MNINFSPNEARVIGCLLEKEVTTPDQYPLTLNAITTACNQKSSREPVMALTDTEVLDTVELLKSRHYIQEVTGSGSRVAKFQHRFCNTEFSTFQFSAQEKGAVCVMLLRGAQSAGEIRTRTNRLCKFSDVKEAEAVLDHLAEHPKGPFVVKLPRENGKRDCRYMHLFSGAVDVDNFVVAAPAVTNAKSNVSEERIVELEEQVASLTQDVAELRELLESLTS
ncbi:YceH family protein [Photobacterium sanguinicancri]|uniref:YceH family protein n=1 Tax=Photobacterium sanguinicancri TaxID=875932 RepID=UPI0026E43657|nr:YceH family protein [Photobacterium sanguinicancri]MDO6499145.1 YceH family protein [Photobacterium sanguinicancri]